MKDILEKVKVKWKDDKHFRIGVILGAVVLIAIIGQCAQRPPAGDPTVIPDQSRTRD